MAFYTIVNLPRNTYEIRQIGTGNVVRTVAGFKDTIRVATELEHKARAARFGTDK